MQPECVVKEAFAVIGLEGSTEEGEGFVQRLWAEANARFPEVEPLALRNENGCLRGVWGAMTDSSRSFLPWTEHFTQGLYLAGVECALDAQPPEGWVKWIVPGFAYLRAERESDDTFADMLGYMQEHGMALAGAAQDFTCPATGKHFILFPIRRL
ncbi:MAG: GyrI-like domain-containing protein [Aristaeellaceae bacterium]